MLRYVQFEQYGHAAAAGSVCTYKICRECVRVNVVLKLRHDMHNKHQEEDTRVLFHTLKSL